MRGPSWDWLEQDGGVGGVGIVVSRKPGADAPSVVVQWPPSSEGRIYRYNGDKLDVVLAAVGPEVLSAATL